MCFVFDLITIDFLIEISSYHLFFFQFYGMFFRYFCTLKSCPSMPIRLFPFFYYNSILSTINIVWLHVHFPSTLHLQVFSPYESVGKPKLNNKICFFPLRLSCSFCISNLTLYVYIFIHNVTNNCNLKLNVSTVFDSFHVVFWKFFW